MKLTSREQLPFLKKQERVAEMKEEAQVSERIIWSNTVGQPLLKIEVYINTVVIYVMTVDQVTNKVLISRPSSNRSRDTMQCVHYTVILFVKKTI